ncbi:endoribonuclease CG2145-like isoform X1 [Maniola jurtina]|uniref:endoribonuclease CG2145-like isoform X1 n=1 Tax=Maniola jurtina TaxID=191418 RepID=UPI001E687718|nr:endoribonuclease CG2145-like isoform X1 [Maniola jurtina]
MRVVEDDVSQRSCSIAYSARAQRSLVRSDRATGNVVLTRMKLSIVFLLCVAACQADDIASAAGQIFQNILPSLITNSVTGQQGNTGANTLQQIGSVVGGVVDYAKKKSYEDLLRQVQAQTSDDDLLRVGEEMFNADLNNAINYIQVNLQGKTTPMSRNDEAQASLLTVPDNVWNGPTIRPMVALFDNYHKNVIRPEFVTPNEETEVITYINTILATGPIRSLMTFLVSKGLTQMNEYNEQVELLKKIWFTKYARHWTSLCKCSCAFENVFMAELKSNDVLGLHSWLFFAKREQDRKANYLGYIDKLDLSGKGLILKQHSILSDTKDAPEVNMFVGTSPELETALYTLCFMARPDRPCKLRYNNVPFTIQTKTVKADNIPVIDTAYPYF